MPEGLPPHLNEEVVNAKAEFYHNWLYSVVPVSFPQYVLDYNEIPARQNTEFPLKAVLAGYCRNCGRAFTQVLETNESGYREQQLQVAKSGCVAP